MAQLDTEVRFIKGIGETRAKSFEKLGVYTLRDLIMDYPRTYEDRREIKKISELQFGETVCVLATVAAPARLSRIRKGLDITKTRAVDDSGSLNITFFNQSYVKNSLVPGESYIFFGRVAGRIGAPEMTNPVFEKESAEPTVTRCIFPIYRLTKGLSQLVINRAVKQGLSQCVGELPEQLPASVCREYKLAQTDFAYNNIHFPKSTENLELARRRLIFEELFVLSCALQMMRGSQIRKNGQKIAPVELSELLSRLPFELTGAQRRAVDDVLTDMAAERPMSRLVQGDVGSGKTVVAAAVCWAVFKSGYQSAFMVPTEILAEQHYKYLTELLVPLGVKVELLTGSLGAKARRETLARISSGEADVVVGTHALISDNVEFSNLALIVADEQHRFGVQQRVALSEKGTEPHVLVMSATPIPRTLALIVYGDLDVSVIDELPPGRQKVDTFLVGEDMRQRIYNFIRRLVSEGRQVFIVCPAVEETEETPDGLKSVKEYMKTLSEKIFPDLSVGMVHGKMKPKEKNETMQAFAEGSINILVATTVIEVGVDIPNAALMVVENADRFGLSQLHQLRGRVGRGKFKSYCVLFEGADGETSRERLKAMCKTNDGFKIAEEDLRIRGPGDFFGSRQSGLPDMHIAGLTSDMELLQDAQNAAKKLMKSDPELTAPENRTLRDSVVRMLEENKGSFN
jgi:ATP-dependent DNA helicase RecG